MTLSPGMPTGRPGTALAIGLLVLLLAAAWLGIAAPLFGIYQDRAVRVGQDRARLAHMQAIVATLPALREAAPAAQTGAAMLDGTDAIAAATLQGTVQSLATKAGATISSVETMPPVPAGTDRRIGLRVSLSAPWPVLVHLLQALAQANPAMQVTDLALHAAPAHAASLPLTASFAVSALRAGGPS